MNAINLEKAQREQNRWFIILTLNAARPLGANEQLILTTLQAIPAQITAAELRREIDYLKDRSLVEVKNERGPVWHAELTRHGVDVAEYTVDVEPGIARPEKYW